MKSFRIHTTQAPLDDRIPYLLLRFLGGDRVSLQFDALESEAADVIPQVTLTSNALYELLEGKALSLEREDGTVSFIPQGQELLIKRNAQGPRPERLYHVWTAEVGVAWNLMGRI